MAIGISGSLNQFYSYATSPFIMISSNYKHMIAPHKSLSLCLSLVALLLLYLWKGVGTSFSFSLALCRYAGKRYPLPFFSLSLSLSLSLSACTEQDKKIIWFLTVCKTHWLPFNFFTVRIRVDAVNTEISVCAFSRCVCVNYMSHKVRKQPLGVIAQWRFRSACAFAETQADLSLWFAHTRILEGAISHVAAQIMLKEGRVG